MKCEVCLELLEEYLDGELAAADHEQIDAHLVTCSGCSESFAALTAEQEMFARYDREIEVPPFMWTRVAAHTVSETNVAKPDWRRSLAALFARPLAAAVAILLFAVAMGLVYVVSRRQPSEPKLAQSPQQRPVDPPKNNDKPATPIAGNELEKREAIASVPKRRPKVRPTTTTHNQSDVLSSDTGYLDMDERDTARHIRLVMTIRSWSNSRSRF